jgi:broad specificity phosphatase PhoE
MRTIYLIRHASPNIQPQIPAPEWALSERGQREAEALAGTAEGWGVEAIYASTEPKARGTALIVGDALGLPVHVVPSFDELRIPHDWITNSGEFNELVQAILTRTDPAPRGCELADVAAARFAEGIDLVIQGPMPAAVVSHGRILSSYLAHYFDVGDAFEYWRSIPMPGWTAVDLDKPGAIVPAFAS